MDNLISSRRRLIAPVLRWEAPRPTGMPNDGYREVLRSAIFQPPVGDALVFLSALAAPVRPPRRPRVVPFPTYSPPFAAKPYHRAWHVDRAERISAVIRPRHRGLIYQGFNAVGGRRSSTAISSLPMSSTQLNSTQLNSTQLNSYRHSQNAIREPDVRSRLWKIIIIERREVAATVGVARSCFRFSGEGRHKSAMCIATVIAKSQLPFPHPFRLLAPQSLVPTCTCTCACGDTWREAGPVRQRSGRHTVSNVGAAPSHINHRARQRHMLSRGKDCCSSWNSERCISVVIIAWLAAIVSHGKWHVRG